MKYMFVLGVASALAFTSCTSVRVEREDVNSGSPICVTARGVGQNTKAMLDGDSFCRMGNALQIWDVYMGGSPVAYIDGKYVVSVGGGGRGSAVRPELSGRSAKTLTLILTLKIIIGRRRVSIVFMVFLSMTIP